MEEVTPHPSTCCFLSNAECNGKYDILATSTDTQLDFHKAPWLRSALQFQIFYPPAGRGSSLHTQLFSRSPLLSSVVQDIRPPGLLWWQSSKKSPSRSTLFWDKKGEFRWFFLLLIEFLLPWPFLEKTDEAKQNATGTRGCGECMFPPYEAHLILQPALGLHWWLADILSASSALH